MITIKEIFTKRELKQFVTFPFSLYKNNKYWVPPIINDEVASFDKKKNPVFEHANARFFLAYKGNRIVGRVCAIINWTEVNQQKIKKMRFGWFDVVDDIEVSKILIEKVKEIGFQNKLEYIEGPVGFSNLDKVGLITEGYDHISTMVTWYNHPYYVTHLEKLGFVKAKGYLENKFVYDHTPFPKYQKFSSVIKKRYKLKALTFTSTKQLLPYTDEMFDVFENSYSKLASYVPISQKQRDYFKKKYISFINPEYIKFVVDTNGKIIAFGIMMPSFSRALQKANGRLFPFGIFHLLNAKKNSKDVISYLIGVNPEYQSKGVTAIIFEEFMKVFDQKGLQNFIRTPELEENTAIHQLWKSFDSKTFRKRSTFRLDI
ncbi:MAG: GTP cyclohydrolase [Flavobacteriaceae bacterium]|nr:GTP cyclohydrolase [Flavobacteriaceae bacterium]